MKTTRFIPFVLSFAAGAALAAAEETRPNIMWIVSEDNAPFLGCYGYPDAKTPHLDRLASQGILYLNAFANAPVCAPARCTIITGVHASSMGTQHMRSQQRIPEGIRLFPRYLREAGYYCTNHSKTDYNLSPVDKNAWDAISRGDHTKRKSGQPFFAVYNIGTSHESSLHRAVDESLAEAKVTVPPYHPEVPEIRANWAMYHQVVTRMDGEVGERLAALDREGVADDTIVFYFSDHAGILPRSKRFLYDTGVHVPMMIRFGENVRHLAPQPPGTKTDRPVSFVDLAPTVLSLAGIPVPAYMQGHAFLGTQAAEPQPYVYLFRGRMDERYDFMRAVRDSRFKYIRNYMPHRIYGQHLNYLWKMPATLAWEREYRAGRCAGPQRYFWEPKPVEELYDVAADPWEVKNLARDPAHAEVLARMRRANREHIMRIRDSGFMPEAEMGRRGDPPPLVYDLVRDQTRYPLDRIVSIAELAGEGRPENLPALSALLTDHEPVLRFWAATGLAILGERCGPAKGPLLKALEDPAPDVRITAAEALARLGETERAVPVLVAALGCEGYAALRAINVLDLLGDAARPVWPAIDSAAKRQGSYVARVADFMRGRFGEAE